MHERVAQEQLVQPRRLPDDGEVGEQAVDGADALANVGARREEAELLREVDLAERVEREVLQPRANVDGLPAALAHLVDAREEEVDHRLHVRLEVRERGHRVGRHGGALEVRVVLLGAGGEEVREQLAVVEGLDDGVEGGLLHVSSAFRRICMHLTLR